MHIHCELPWETKGSFKILTEDLHYLLITFSTDCLKPFVVYPSANSNDTDEKNPVADEKNSNWGQICLLVMMEKMQRGCPWGFYYKIEYEAIIDVVEKWV